MLLVSETVYFEELQTTHGTFTFHVYEFADGRRTLEIACQAPNKGFVDILVIPNEDLEEFHRAYCRAAQAVRRERWPVWEMREQYPNAYYPWTDKESQQLQELHANKTSLQEIVRQMGRSPAGINGQLLKLGIEVDSLRNSSTPQPAARREPTQSRTGKRRTAPKSELDHPSGSSQRSSRGFEDEFSGF